MSSMDEFGIEIRIDPGQSNAAIGKTEKKLDDLGKTGEEAGAKASKAIADIAPSAQKAATSADKLHKELTKSLKGFGGFSLAANTAKAAIAGLIGPAAIVGLISKIISTETALEKATKQVEQYARSNEMAKVIAIEQIKVAGQLNTTTEQAIKLYDALNKVGQQYYLTTQRQVEAQRALGDALARQGTSPDAAGGILGVIGADKVDATALARVLRDNASVAELLTKNLSMTRTEMIALARDGKLAGATLIGGLRETADVTKSLEERERKRIANMTGLAKAYEPVRIGFRKADEDRVKFLGEIAAIEDVILQTNRKLLEVVDNVTIATKNRGSGLGINAAFANLQGLDQWGMSHIEKLEPMLKKLGIAVEKRTAAAAKAGQEHAAVLQSIEGPQKKYLRDLEILDSLYKRNKISLEQYSTAMHAAADAHKSLADQRASEAADAQINLLAAEAERREQAEKDAHRAAAERQEDTRQAFIENRAAQRDYNEQLRQTAEIERKNRDGIGRGFKAIGAEIMDVASLTERTLLTSFHRLEDSLVSLFTTGKGGFKAMIDAMIADFARLAIRQGMASIIGAIFPGAGAAAAFAGSRASGGSFTVGGSGGPDSVPVSMRLSPRETVTVTRPGEPAGGGTAQATTVVNNIVDDPRALISALSTDAGARAIANTIQRNPGLFRGVLGR